jgi:16S rRNA (cytosine1402-N4)-methyltransferase
MSKAVHIPVLLNEVVESLKPADNEIFVDATFGAGGYSRAILSSAKCRVFGIDRDPNVGLLADALARDFPGHFLFLAGRFSAMVSLLAEVGVSEVDGIVMDLGVSSMQLDQPERGFSFAKDAPLDMRMGVDGRSAADLIAHGSESELADIFYQFGEEKASRRIARAIVNARSVAPITRTTQLAEIISGVGGVERRPGMHPATRSFQALRIAVNEELDELRAALEAAEKLLKPGGRLVVVTFHSLEDRIVKQFFNERAKEQNPSRHLPAAYAAPQQESRISFALMHKKPLQSGDNELQDNIRARSAKLRAAIRLKAA